MKAPKARGHGRASSDRRRASVGRDEWRSARAGRALVSWLPSTAKRPPARKPIMTD